MLPEYFGGLNSATNTQSQKNHACPLPMPLSVGSLRSTKVARRVVLSKGGSPVSGVWHLVNHAPWHGEDDPWVEFARAAAFKEGAVHKRAPRSPVSIEHLACLRRGISLSNLSTLPFGRWLFARSGDAVDWARLPLQPRPHSIAPIMFFALLRTPSFIPDDISLICLMQHSFREFRDGTRSVSVRIPWTKTTKNDGASVILTARGDTLCPRRALENHLAINNDVPGSAALFAYRTESGGSQEYAEADVSRIRHVYLANGSSGHVLGHSFGSAAPWSYYWRASLRRLSRQ